MAEQTAPPPPRRGFFVNVGSLVFARAFVTFSQLLILPIIARHLEVADFALMALAMTVVIFSTVLSDAGLGRSLIRSQGYDPVEWASVFWLLVGVGLLLGGAVLAIAPLWAWFFALPDLWPVLSVLALVPLCQALSAAPNAEIERRENYTALAQVQMLAAGLGLVAAVALALLGAGVWALVVQQVLLALVRLLGIAYLTEFRPQVRFLWEKVGGHLIFARDAVTISLISTVQSQMATVFIGKFLGQGALGFFAMSQRFTRLPQFGLAGPMSAVVYVRMAKAQSDPSRLAEIYFASSRLLAALLFPPFAMVAVAGEAIFTVLLSAKWGPVAPVFALSIPGFVLEAVTVTYLACLFRALGETGTLVRLKTEGALLNLVLVLAASFVSLEAVAAAITLWSLIYVPRGWHLAGRRVPLGFAACLGALARPALVSGLAACIHVVLRARLDPAPWAEIGMALALTFLALGLAAALDWRRLSAAVATFRQSA